MKRFSVVLIVLTLFTFVVAYSTTITWLGGDWLKNVLTSFKPVVGYNLLDKFKEETGITVKVETYPFDALFQAIQTRMVAKSPSFDVFEVDSPLTASYATLGYIKPLSDYLGAGELNRIKSRFFPATVAMSTWKKKLYTVPFENSSQFMYVNLDLFKEAGVTPPSTNINDRWTWQQVVNAAKEIQNKLNKKGKQKVWGLLFEQVSRPYQMLPLPQSLGAGSGVSPDGLHVKGYLDNAGWLKAMQWWYNVNNVWKISPKGVQAAESPSWFVNGKVAMYIGGTWNIATILNLGGVNPHAAEFKWRIVPHPYFAGGVPVTSTTSWTLAVNPYSKNAAAAVKFIEFLTNEKTMADWFRVSTQLPANEKAAADVINNDPLYKKFPWNSYKQITLYELSHTAVNRPVTPFYGKWENLVYKAFEDVRNGGNPKVVLERYTNILERMAAQYR